MTERWRSLPVAAQDAAIAAAFALCWFGSFWYLRQTGWNPVRPVPYLLAGGWSAAALLLRRVAPLPCFVVTVLCYPLVFDPPMQTEFQLLPILLAGYAATGSRARSIGVAAASMAAVFVMTVYDPFLGPWDQYISWDTVLVNEFATVCVVALGALMHEQRRSAEELAARNAELERLRAVESEQAIAQERTRIARELHDVAAHHLTALIVRAQAADRVAETDPDATRETLRWVVTTARDALNSMRQTVRVLRAEGEQQSYVPEPSLEDLPGIVERMRGAGLDVSLTIGSDLPRMGQQRELAVVRIAQEALTNTLRHAHARHAAVSLWRRGDVVVLDVDDDGSGAARASDDTPGHGLIGMRERAASCGGSLHLGRSDLGGWQVRATFPTEAAA